MWDKFVSVIGNPWTLFAFSILSFSISVYFLTGLLVVWGIGLLIAAIVRFSTIDKNGNIHRRNY